MGTTFRGIDVINKRINVLGIGVVVLHGNFYIDIIPGSLTVKHLLIQRLFSLV